MPLTAGHTEQSLRAARARWLAAIAFLGLGACFTRLIHLQLVRGAALSRASVNNHTQVLVERAPRGRILDRNGQVLADDQPVFVALFSPIGLKPDDFPRVVERLSGILDVQPEELQRRLRAATRARAMMRVSDRLDRSQAFRILQDRIHMPGVSLTIEEQRFYPNATLASHVMGYVGQITDEELDAYSEQGYYPGDWIGKSGLERLYDPSLHGQDGGYLIEVDAHGRQVRVLRHVMPRAGKDLVLTLDRTVQEMAEKRLGETKKPGAAVVMNPMNGEVLALASSPGFNPNSFLPLGDSDERRRLLEDPKLPLYNRAIQALYPPGSIFKIVTSLAALESGAMDPAKKLFCDGAYTLGKERRIFKCWKPHGHGYVNFIPALAQSCDVYYYQLGQETGSQAIETMAKKMGLGQITGIDLPNEKKARYLPMAFKESKRQHWMGGDTLNYAIGQGFLQVSPMQNAALISQVAANGAYWQPFLVSRTRTFGQEDEVINQPHMIVQNSFSAEALKLVQDGLHEVVRAGTGVGSKIEGVELAGKTGTAQATKGTGDHAWFVAYGPVEAPKVACAVLVEHGGHGGSIAAPIAHDLIAQVLGVNARPAAERDIESD